MVIFPVNWMSNGEKKGDKTTGNNNQHDHCVHAGTAEGMGALCVEMGFYADISWESR